MKNFVTFLNIIGNLKNIPRHGPLLFAGVKTSNIQEHSFMVAIIAASLIDDMRAEGFTINGENLLKVAITHDIAEGILGDIPTTSPSYRSFFEEDIKAIYKKAEINALNQLLTLIEGREGAFSREVNLSDVEADLLKISDIIAVLLEVIDMKFQYQYAWIEKFWNATLKRLREYERYSFVQAAVAELASVYAQDKKPFNPLLTKQEFN